MGNPQDKIVTVEWEGLASLEKITEKLKEINYLTE